MMDQEDLVDHMEPGWNQELTFMLMTLVFILMAVVTFIVFVWRLVTGQHTCAS